VQKKGANDGTFAGLTSFYLLPLDPTRARTRTMRALSFLSIAAVSAALFILPGALAATDPILSGPQPGEKTTGFKVIEIGGPAAGTERNPILDSAGAPTAKLPGNGRERGERMDKAKRPPLDLAKLNTSSEEGLRHTVITLKADLNAVSLAPILLIKTAWGGKSLHTDFHPPSAGPHGFNETQLAQFQKQGKAIIIYAWNEHDEGGRLQPTLGSDGKPDEARIRALGKVLNLK
jgi:hypothetical protein